MNDRRYVITGDMATVEDDGTIRLLGRGSGCINTGGEKVFPEEVEAVLKAHDSVYDALVVGVPDERWGEVGAAFLVVAPGTTASGDELREFLAPNFAKFWLPDRFEFMTEIPKTSVGKFLKTELRDMFASEQVPS